MENIGLKQDRTLAANLKARFEKNTERHPDVKRADVEARLAAHPAKLKLLQRMEETGGEPDVIGREKSGEFIFCDCAPESPAGRRSLCYDRQALDARKENKPAGNASDLAAEMGVELLTEAQYFDLQRIGRFDLKTSSWLKTPGNVRERGGAIFGDRRYDRVFIYHNGADSYYAASGFRGLLKV